MWINLLDLLNQIKKAVIQEKWSISGLLMYFFFLMVVSDWVIKILATLWYPQFWPYMILGLFVSAFIIWLGSRQFPIKKHKINIAIANNDVINISTQNFLTAEQKLQISSEVVNYFYARLSHLEHEIWIGNYLNFFKLPPRISTDYWNCDNLTSKIWVDMLMRGTIRSQWELFYLNTKITVDKTITSYFFRKLIEHLNNYQEIEFSFSQSENLEFDKYLYETTFIASIYYSFELIYVRKFEQAEQLLLQIIATLQKTYDDSSITSVTRWDDDFELIEILMYDSIAKLYYQRSEQSLSDFDFKNQVNTLLEKAASFMSKQLDLIKKHIKKKEFTTIWEELQLQAEYIYQLGELSKTWNNKVIQSYIKKLPLYLWRYAKSLWWFVAVQFKDYEHAVDYYLQAYQADNNDLLALRWLWVAYFYQKKYKQALHYLMILYHHTHHNLFFVMLYDDKVTRLIYQSAFEIKQYYEWILFKIKNLIYKRKNKMIEKKFYTI